MTYSARIYKIVNSVNDEIYVGSTKNELRVRFQQHRNDIIRDPHRNKMFELANEYGWGKFRIILIETIDVNDKSHQLQIEQKYIDELKPYMKKNTKYPELDTKKMMKNF